MARGAGIAARAIGSSLGPQASTVLLERVSGRILTKDGATIARELSLNDPLLQLGAAIIIDACLRVNKDVGDGTTTTAVIANGIIQEGAKAIVSSQNPVGLVQEIRDACTVVLSKAQDMALPIGTKSLIQRVAMIASNGDRDIADALATASIQIGKLGNIQVTGGESTEPITLELKSGISLKGCTSPYFLEAPTERVLDGALVAVVPKMLSDVKDVLRILEEASKFPENPCLIVSKEISGGALATLSMNDRNIPKDNGPRLRCAPLFRVGDRPYREESMKDIAALSGALYVDSHAGYDHKEFKAEWFGSVRKATLGLNKFVLEGYPDKQPFIMERLQRLQQEIEASLHPYDTDRLKERMAMLQGGLALVKVGGTTDTEIKERRARVEDAIHALDAALRGGVLPGGGVAYLRLSQALEETPEGQTVGGKVLAKALKVPILRLLLNAGVEPQSTIDKLRSCADSWVGWDLFGHTARDFGGAPEIVDPYLVVKHVIGSAVSAATTLLAADAAITRVR